MRERERQNEGVKQIEHEQVSQSEVDRENKE